MSVHVCLFYCVVVFWKREKQGRVTLLFLFILDVTNGQSTKDYASGTSNGGDKIFVFVFLDGNN